MNIKSPSRHGMTQRGWDECGRLMVEGFNEGLNRTPEKVKERIIKSMNEKDFTLLCKKAVAEYENEHMDVTDGKTITEDDVYVVWMCKTLQNNKALLSTTLFNGMYYELTYNGDKKELYVDAYKKWENKCIKV